MPAIERRGAVSRPVDDSASLRKLLLALVLLGAAGLAAELLLLEHFESFRQWLPLLVLAGAFATGIALAARPNRATVRIFQATMLLCIAAGLLGLVLHYRGNAAFEREMDASVRGFGLFWSALRGATPALAPGALVQLGILGLIPTYRHPALSAPHRSTPFHAN